MAEQTPGEPLLITVEEAAKLLRLGQTKVYELIGREGLPVVRFGRAVRVDPADLRHWLEERKQQDDLF
jgi:excisionase family DNA binding protein